VVHAETTINLHYHQGTPTTNNVCRSLPISRHLGTIWEGCRMWLAVFTQAVTSSDAGFGNDIAIATSPYQNYGSRSRIIQGVCVSAHIDPLKMPPMAAPLDRPRPLTLNV